MSQVVDAARNLIKLDNGQVITANQGGWYDGQQYWGGTLSDKGVINPLSNQQGAGQAVSKETVDQTNPNNWNYLHPSTPSTPSAPSGGGGNLNIPALSGGSAGSGSGIPGGFGVTAPTINLPDLYKNLYDQSGISAIEADLSAKEKAYNDRISKINDNPYLSEATRTGRLAKLSTDHQNSIASLKNDIAIKKADVEMKLNLQAKQFDINSTQAQQALQQFNSLLQMGALENASGEDIANIVRSTGLSSTMIINAINKQKVGNIKPHVIESTDDNGNVTVNVIDLMTGKTISTQNLGKIGKADHTGAGGLTTTQSRSVLGAAGTILADVDRTYQTVNGTAKNIETQYNKNKLKGDLRLSLQEYQIALQQLMNQTGLDMATADDYLTKQMQQQGYSKWRW